MTHKLKPKRFKSTFIYIALLYCSLSACNQRVEQTKASSELTAFTDTTFWQEFHDPLPVKKNSAANEVRSIAVSPEGDAWIATKAGVFFKKRGATEWIDAIPLAEQGPSFAVKNGNGSTWISTWKGVYQFKDNRLTTLQGVVAPISSLCVTKEGTYAAGPQGIWLCRDGNCEKKPFNIARSVRDVESDKNSLWVGTDVGLFQITPSQTEHFIDTTHLVSAYVRGVARDASGNIWAGGLGGISVLDGSNVKIKTLKVTDGMPSYEVRCLTYSPDSIMWIGTDMGVVRYESFKHHSLRFSRRWLLHDKVNDIAFDPQGNAWIATDGGVSVIRRKRMTLATKEAYFYDVLMKRHIREPWIAGQCRLIIPGDTSKWEPEDDDNDGEYTGNYLAMESFRYAVTKDDEARVKAGKAFRFLKLLREVTESDGFFARTIVPSTWPSVHDGNQTFTEREKADELVKEPRFKPVETRWRKSKDGKWLWKGDTSSDEICGHMFGYYFYYELVADSAEKKIVASHVAAIVDHLMAHDFTLTDVDGKPTRWGVWSPDKLNRDHEWSPDRSLNSMELLSFLKFAFHVTGQQKYQDKYLNLIAQEKYIENMEKIPQQNPAWFIYFDVILAAYQYPILLMCEKDPTLLKRYEDHIDRWMAMRMNDNNPLINFIYSYARHKKSGLQSSVEFLTDTPLDLVDWTIDHTRRDDVKIVKLPVLGELQVSELQPASIRATVRWDKNPLSISPGNHHVEREPVFWLLPYWMGRYLEMIR